MNESSIKLADTLDRRQFLKATGGLLLAITLDGSTNRSVAQGVVASNITTYLSIGADESVTVFVGGGEMGQGIYTGLAMAAAEELKVDWSAVKVQPLTAASSWLSAGSGGIRSRLPTFLKAGAAAREMLISAAANQWGVARALCVASGGGVVTNSATGDTLTYGQLAPAAALLAVPAAPPLTPAAQYQIIGTPAARVDLPPKTNGSAKYGVDTFLPGMVFAAVKHSPVIGGTLTGTITKPSGAIAAVPLLPLTGTVPNAVGVVATNTYLAHSLANGISSTKWTTPADAPLRDSTVFQKQAQQLLGRGTPYVSEKVGDVEAGLANAVTTVDLTYGFPYLSHCCMEVLSCTVRLTGYTAGPPAAGTCEIWAPTQAPNSTLTTAATWTGLAKTAITIYPTLMGGGLGRKFEQDYIAQAIQIAKALPSGTPVKMIWKREQDMANDQFRPMALIRIRAGLDANGNVTAWNCRHVSPSISKQRGATLGAKGDANATEGATALPYVFGSRLVDYVVHPSPIPVGYWRSVGYSLNAFAVESTIDELALAGGIDPFNFRVQLLQNSTDPLAARTLACLQDAAANAGWGNPLPAGRARGIAVSMAFNTIVAECAEISATATSIRVYKVACTVDCGTAVNPDSVEAQMQGGIFHGLSAAMWGQVKWTAGVAGASNFNNYRVLRMNEAPNITVNIINSGAPMSGCGEPGVPPIAPAVANAYRVLTGKRVTTLPFFPGATMDGI